MARILVKQQAKASLGDRQNLKSLAHIRIVVVEPAGALNIGSIARVMKNMGLSDLTLVNPRCEHLGEEARLMAVHASEILENTRIVDSLPEALKGCKKAIATTGQPRELSTPMETPRSECRGVIMFPRESGTLGLKLQKIEK